MLEKLENYRVIIMLILAPVDSATFLTHTITIPTSRLLAMAKIMFSTGPNNDGKVDDFARFVLPVSSFDVQVQSAFQGV